MWGTYDEVLRQMLIAGAPFAACLGIGSVIAGLIAKHERHHG
jgi:hypothetical protein